MVFSEDNEQCNSCRGRLKTVPDVYKVALGIFMVYYNSIASLTCRLAEYKLSRAEKCDQIFSLTLVWSGGIILKRNRVRCCCLKLKCSGCFPIKRWPPRISWAPFQHIAFTHIMHAATRIAGLTSFIPRLDSALELIY
jgi:hypothetical protein